MFVLIVRSPDPLAAPAGRVARPFGPRAGETVAAVSWTGEGADFHAAECRLGAGVVVHLLVEKLDERCWDWQVWEPSRCLRAGRGVADTLEAAKVRAELAATGAVACARAELAELFGRLRQRP